MNYWRLYLFFYIFFTNNHNEIIFNDFSINLEKLKSEIILQLFTLLNVIMYFVVRWFHDVRKYYRSLLYFFFSISNVIIPLYSNTSYDTFYFYRLLLGWKPVRSVCIIIIINGLHIMQYDTTECLILDTRRYYYDVRKNGPP